MEKEREKKASTDEGIMPKRILILIVRPPHQGVRPHVPNNGERTGDEHDLHQGVVH